MDRREEIARAIEQGAGDVGLLMEAYSLDAIAHARTTAKIPLDYAFSSIERVERILGQLAKARASLLMRLLRRTPDTDTVNAMAKMYGGYVGEVMRRSWGGHWALGDAAPFDGAYVLVCPHFTISPPARAYARLMGGAREDIWAYTLALRSDHHAAREGAAQR